MRILVVRETNPFAISNATNNRFLTLVEGLAENGCTIELLFVNGFYSTSEKKKFNKFGLFNKLSYKYLLPLNYSSFFIRQFFYRIFPNRYVQQKIMTQLKKINYDILWLDFSPKIVEIGLNLFKKKISVKYFHERSEYSWTGFNGNNKLHRRYLKLFLPQIDILSVMTDKLSNYYKAFVGKNTKIILLPMTVDFFRFKEIIKETNLCKPYIAYCGAMSNEKDGVNILIQSFIKISDNFPEYHLYLAGPLFPEKDYIMQQKLISDANLGSRITYLGNLNRDEVPIFLFNSNVLALARPNTKQSEGGFPTKLGEYLATGRPVCVTNTGEICKYLKDNESAFIAKPDSVDSFANALINALTNRNATKIGASGKSVALCHFNKDIQALKLYHILLKLQN